MVIEIPELKHDYVLVTAVVKSDETTDYIQGDTSSTEHTHTHSGRECPPSPGSEEELHPLLV